MKLQHFATAAVATLLMTTSSHALDISIGGIDASVSLGGDSVASVSASVGGSDGVNADATVGGGSVATANASVGGTGGVGANVNVGGSGGGGTNVAVGIGGTNNGTNTGVPNTTTNTGTKSTGIQVARRGNIDGSLLTKSQKASSIMRGMIVLSRDKKLLGIVEQVRYNADGSANILMDVNPAYRARVEQVWLQLTSLGAPDDAVDMNITQASFLQSVL